MVHTSGSRVDHLKRGCTDSQGGKHLVYDYSASRLAPGRRGGATAILCPLPCTLVETWTIVDHHSRGPEFSTTGLSSCCKTVTTEVFAHLSGRN